MVKPIKDHILVKCRKKERQTSGGSILPDVGHVQQNVGTVVRVGPGRYHESGLHKGKFVPTYLKEGDQVLFTIEGAEPLSWMDDNEWHYEMIKGEEFILGTIS